jgi:hypothetical protein
MPGLSRELVEHQLPVKSGFRPYKQPARRFNPIIHDRVKEEVERLLDTGFRACLFELQLFKKLLQTFAAEKLAFWKLSVGKS